MTPPMVSVVLPVYNGERFLAQALDSLLQQTYPDWELLAIDDGSRDGTAAILEDYARRDGRVLVFSQENQGLIASLNRGIQQAGGRYLARMDADDLAHPERLARQVAYLEANPAVVICGSGFTLIGESGEYLGAGQLPGQRARTASAAPAKLAAPVVSVPPLDDTGIRWQVLFNTPFAHPSVCMRLETLRQHELCYNPLAYLVEDYELWSRLLQCGRAGNLPQPLLQYRQHARQVSRQRQDTQWVNATHVSQANLACLGVTLPIQQVDRLRQWNDRFPAWLQPEDAPLCELLLIVLRRFAAQPGLDPRSLALIRGRWLLKLFLTPGRGLGRRYWLRGLSSSDVRAALQAGLWRLVRGRR